MAEVEFAGWTANGNLRHASFLGLREDRDPRSIGREKAQAVAAAAPGLPRIAAIHAGSDLVIDGACYYAAIGDLILPQIAGRPVNLTRCPDRLGKGRFYQRHRARGMPDSVHTVRIGAGAEDHVANRRPARPSGAGPVRRHRVPPLGCACRSAGPHRPGP